MTPVNAQLKHEPRIHLRRPSAPAVVSTTEPSREPLELVIEDLIKGRTHGLRTCFTNHCRMPEKMRPRTLWNLYLLRLRYEQTPAYHALRLQAIRDILDRVPRGIKAQVRVPQKADLTESQT
jgi:hypothetical protein